MCHHEDALAEHCTFRLIASKDSYIIADSTIYGYFYRRLMYSSTIARCPILHKLTNVRAFSWVTYCYIHSIKGRGYSGNSYVDLP